MVWNVIQIERNVKIISKFKTILGSKRTGISLKLFNKMSKNWGTSAQNEGSDKCLKIFEN